MCLNIVYKWNLKPMKHTMGNSMQMTTCIAYMGNKISGILWRGVFCVHKPYSHAGSHYLYVNKQANVLSVLGGDY